MGYFSIIFNRVMVLDGRQILGMMDGFSSNFLSTNKAELEMCQ